MAGILAALGAFVALGATAVLGAALWWLIRQSKHPSGAVGRWMMRLWNRAYLPMARWALDSAGPFRPQSILDIGCGNGASTRLLSQRFPGAQVLGVEISKEAVTAAQNGVQDSRVAFALGNVHHMAFARSGSTDLATAFQTHFHWKDFHAAMEELYRVLKPGGRLLLACERNKLPIYLKEYASPEQMKALAAKTGFTQTEYSETPQWCAWSLKKDPPGPAAI